MQEEKFTFEEKLSQTKERLGLSWTELGDRLDIGKTMLHYLKKGEREPSEKIVRRLSQLNACEPDDVSRKSTYPQSLSPDRRQMVAESYPPGKPPTIEDRLQVLENQHRDIMEMLSEIREAQNQNFRDSEENKGTTDEH